MLCTKQILKKEEHKHKHTVRTNHQLKGVPTAALRAFLFAKVSIISLKSSCFAKSDSTANVPKEVNRIWHIVDRIGDSS